MWNCVSMASGGLSVPTHGTTEMLLLSADRLDTHHLVSQWVKFRTKSSVQ